MLATALQRAEAIYVFELAAQGLAVVGLVEGLAARHGAWVDGFGVDVEGAVRVHSRDLWVFLLGFRRIAVFVWSLGLCRLGRRVS